MMVYANIDSVESMNNFQNYENEIEKVLMSFETLKNLKFYPDVEKLVNKFEVKECESLGFNIICGVAE